jgi:hypothetical protein
VKNVAYKKIFSSRQVCFGEFSVCAGGSIGEAEVFAAPQTFGLRYQSQRD